MKARLATEDDFKRILDMMLAMHKEVSTVEPLNIRVLAENVENIIHANKVSGTHGLVVAEANSGELAGFLVCFVAQYFFNEHVRANIQFQYVAPQFRGSRAMILMMQAFGVWGVARKSINLTASVTNKVIGPIERFDKMMTHLGFVNEGRFYRKEIACVR
jgi:hypothetical protein